MSVSWLLDNRASQSNPILCIHLPSNSATTIPGRIPINSGGPISQTDGSAIQDPTIPGRRYKRRLSMGQVQNNRPASTPHSQGRPILSNPNKLLPSRPNSQED
eukprot:Gregarina_sp_Poly_1__5437@NODE_2873_length_1609_cov_10_846952_g1814_i0_p1_GENE_NODE_2873_length_1609_cov_10_846952_g1814_i0NODE_2873_length_1609_cov_10_846952_g1814_i0_p1_ORF_typecomplete_len103_score2_31_NODE_2873_length_1609_cov_10_846952_g1814_i0472780